MSELYDILVETPPTPTLLLALDQGAFDGERSLQELAALCEANHMQAVGQVVQKRSTPETGTVLGSGKLEEARLAAEQLGAQCAVFDGELTGSQLRNIAAAVGIEVIDRTMLILEIFRSRAVTNEGKLQTELALLRYRLPRLQGMGESLSRQGGGGGGGAGARRGAGETKLELDRRHIHARIDTLAARLAELEKRRGESRRARAKTGMPVVSLVGYTNVGKSSLMNALCGPSVAEADMLFATLDPTSRKLLLPSGMAVLLVDTVGFVSRLPHHLVDAFKSTLEEAAWSDVIVQVADASDPQRGPGLRRHPPHHRLQQVRQARRGRLRPGRPAHQRQDRAGARPSAGPPGPAAGRPCAPHQGAAALRRPGPGGPPAGPRQRPGRGVPPRRPLPGSHRQAGGAAPLRALYALSAARRAQKTPPPGQGGGGKTEGF